MKFIVFIIHVLADYILGGGVLNLLRKGKLLFGQIFIAILLGFFIETMISFVVIWSGGTLKTAFYILLGLMLFVNIKRLKQFWKHPQVVFPTKQSFSFITGMKWHSWLLVLLIGQKIAMIVWQLYRMPTFLSDAIKHWSTQGRALHAQVNFSMAPNTWEFLGRKLQVVLEYPLQLPIWRAMSALIGGEWNEFVSRSDSLLFFIIICGIVGSTFWMLTKKRWITLGAVYIIACLPLQVWHGGAGYADIAVEAYVVAAVACFIGKEWLLCGLFMAGAVWSKNDGLALYLPGILAAGFLYHVFSKEVKWITKIRKMSQFVIGFSFVLPWLIFQGLHSNSVFSKVITPIKNLFSYQQYDPTNFEVVLTQVGENFETSPPSYQLFWEHVFCGSTFGIFWLVVFAGLILLSKKLLFDKMGRSLLLFYIITCIIIYYIFTYTPAYEFLLTQTTIHRTLLQFSAAALLVLGYGLSLQVNQDEKVLMNSNKKRGNKLSKGK